MMQSYVLGTGSIRALLLYSNMSTSFLSKIYNVHNYRILEEAKRIYSGHVNVDLIFGRPGQTMNSWISELNKVFLV